MTQKQKEVARVRLSETQEIVATIVDNEKLDLRVFISTDSYKGPTKRGVRFYLFDGIWQEFKKLISAVDQEVKQLE